MNFCLSAVVTRQEAALFWGVALTSVIYHEDKGNLVWRKSETGGTVMITVSSLHKLWGKPRGVIPEWLQETN